MKTRFAPPERLAPDAAWAVSLRLKEELLMPWFDAVPVPGRGAGLHPRQE